MSVSESIAFTRLDTASLRERDQSVVAWAAILAGAAGTVALSLIFVVLGTGLGLSAVSPWAHHGAHAATIGASAILWLAFTQIAAAAVGGYVAGRLRTRWDGVHTDQVYFRDTAHGFLAWALATFATAALLVSTIGGLIHGGAEAGALAGGVAAATVTAGSGHDRADPAAYTVDSLFRVEPSTAAAPVAAPAVPAGPDPGLRPEADRIFINSRRAGGMPATESRYIGQLIVQRSGLSQAAAGERVNSAFTQLQSGSQNAEASVRAAGDSARKAGAYTSLWLFVSLLAGAFAASLSTNYGGRQRDR